MFIINYFTLLEPTSSITFDVVRLWDDLIYMLWKYSYSLLQIELWYRCWEYVHLICHWYLNGMIKIPSVSLHHQISGCIQFSLLLVNQTRNGLMSLSTISTKDNGTGDVKTLKSSFLSGWILLSKTIFRSPWDAASNGLIDLSLLYKFNSIWHTLCERV